MTEDRFTQLVTAERKGKVLTLTLNRAEKSNSLHPDLVRSLSRALREAGSDPDINVLVLTGAGRSFCAGLDLELLISWTPDEKTAYLETVTEMFRLVWSLDQPVIGAINGPAIAGGFDLAAFCDIRLASTEAVFGQAEINLGLTQIIHPLYKTIGLARAKELALTGQNISAEEAYRIGLVNHIYPPAELMARVYEMAEVMAAKPRGALVETKRLTRELIDMETDAALREIGETFIRRLNTPEHRERLAEVYERLKSRK
ncbi:MAG TPA: enoyl-CoA hydratase/isomerase family protein [Blastocatellia bacterium]|nr:enoyl-CoA hydratase/isomerase family protein [Blastocatellia bacterium]